MNLKSLVKETLGHRTCEQLGRIRNRLGKLWHRLLGRSAPLLRSTACFPVPLTHIRTALSQLDIRRGDILLVHSSVAALGKAGLQPDQDTPRNPVLYAQAITEILLDAVGPEGTLLMPTEADGDPRDRARNKTVFDWRTDLSNRGLITELFRRRKDVIRSVHPWYNVSACGRLAEELIKDHDRSTPYTMDRNSPWFKLTEMNGKVLFLGTTLETNSLLHLPEYLYPGEYPRRIFFADPVPLCYRGRDGSIQTMDVMIHVPDWRSGEGTRFCDYLDHKYHIYTRLDLGRSQAVSHLASRQYEALCSELRQRVTWYDVRNW